MQQIILAAVGRLKERYWREALEEYAKRLSRFCRFSLVEVADEPAPERLSPAQRDQVKRAEGARLIAALPGRAYVVALDLAGREMDSPGLADKLETLALSGRDQVAFVIGGSWGLDRAVLDRADARWRLSALTFPHQLCRVMVAEQVYRAYTILKGAPYHK